MQILMLINLHKEEGVQCVDRTNMPCLPCGMRRGIDGGIIFIIANFYIRKT